MKRTFTIDIFKKNTYSYKFSSKIVKDVNFAFFHKFYN